MFVSKLPEKERFMSHVRHADSGCWEWTAFRMPNGYGNFRTPQRHELAHRAAYRLFVGPLSDVDVMHSCDNPACVNPEHLRLGTRKDNMQDASKKGRLRTGERHGRAKLTDEQVAKIRSATAPQAVLAKEFGISQGHVSWLRSVDKRKALGAAQEGNYHR